MTISKKRFIVSFLFLIMLIGGGTILIIRKIAIDAESRRKRDADAYVIRNALVIYMQQYKGTLPLTLSELRFERTDVDPSPFILFDPGLRKGQLGRGVIAEAEQGGNGKRRIVIYVDGVVHWE